MKNNVWLLEVGGLRRTCEGEGAVLLVPDAVGGQRPLEYPQVLQHRVQCTLSVTLNKFTVIINTLFPPIPQADYSQPHYQNFGNFLRRLTFALASTLLIAYSTYSKST